MPQLVNSICSLCANRISSVLGARFCAACGSPVHDDCAASASGADNSSLCSVCGANMAKADLLQCELAKAQLAEDAQARENAAMAALMDAADATAEPRREITTRQIVGSVIAGIGLLVALGNTSGLFPTVPFAGSILMIVGGIVASPRPPRYITIRK